MKLIVTVQRTVSYQRLILDIRIKDRDLGSRPFCKMDTGLRFASLVVGMRKIVNSDFRLRNWYFTVIKIRRVMGGMHLKQLVKE